MIESVPLKESDKVGNSDSIIELFDKRPNSFRKLGYTQYFYLQDNAELPIRDVKNTHNEGHKTEPYLELKAENFCSDCYQDNIKSFTRDLDRRYLFLVTNTRDTELEDEYGRKKWIVGYIEKQRGLKVRGRTAVQGPIKLVSFDDAVSVKVIGADTGFRSNKKLDREQTEMILRRFSEAKNIYERCLERVRKYETEIGRVDPWESAENSLKETTRNEKKSTSNRRC